MVTEKFAAIKDKAALELRTSIVVNAQNRPINRLKQCHSGQVIHRKIFSAFCCDEASALVNEMKALGYEDEVEIKKGKLRSKTRRNRKGEPMAEATNFIGKAVVRAA